MHKAADLPLEDCQVVDRLLGRALQENETVQVRVEPATKQAPEGEPREQAYRTLVEHRQEISAKAESSSEEETTALVDEATSELRQSRRISR